MKFWRRIQKGQFEGDIWSGNFEGTTRNGKREGKIWKRTLGSEFGTVNRNQPKEPLRSTFPNIKFGRQRSEVECRRAYSEVKILLGSFEEQVRKGKVAKTNLDGRFQKRELERKRLSDLTGMVFFVFAKGPFSYPGLHGYRKGAFANVKRKGFETHPLQNSKRIRFKSFPFEICKRTLPSSTQAGIKEGSFCRIGKDPSFTIISFIIHHS